jgi:hypothetical protein
MTSVPAQHFIVASFPGAQLQIAFTSSVLDQSRGAT